MIRLFLPSDGPSWLRRFADSVVEAFRTIMPAPFRLWDVATADLPAPAEHKQGLVFDLTRGTFLLSDGSDWLEYARLSGAAYAGRVDAPTLRATGLDLSGATGPGVEVLVTGGAGYVQCYDRTAATYFSLGLAGSVVNLWAGPTLVAQASASGLSVTGLVTTNGASAGVSFAERDGDDSFLAYMQSDALRFHSAGADRMTLSKDGDLDLGGTAITFGGDPATQLAHNGANFEFSGVVEVDGLIVDNAAGLATVQVGNPTTFQLTAFDGTQSAAIYCDALSFFNISGSTGRMAISADSVSLSVALQLRNRTVANVPSAATAGRGAMVYITNESGGEVPAFSDGTNWRRVTDRAVIS